MREGAVERGDTRTGTPAQKSGVVRVPLLGRCEKCGVEFPPPAAKGIEVFAA